MKAERERRAVILEAQGLKKAQILRAEGSKEAQIQIATGEAEAIKRVAEAEKFRLTTTATGEAEAVEKVFKAIHAGDPTDDLIAIKYMEALIAIANGSANKVFLPYEASSFMGSIGGIVELFKDKIADSAAPKKAPPKPAQPAKK
jgi:regulator of protease activity HflC (stomatin/prohibitin superfamily)